MEFIQHHGAYALQARVGKQPPREHAFGEKAQAGRGSGHFLEAHLVADGPAERLAALAAR